MSELDLGVIGNCSFAALIDRNARVVWFCAPRLDGDPVFHCSARRPEGAPDSGRFRHRTRGSTSKRATLRRQYRDPRNDCFMANTDRCAVTDFAPRFWWRDRAFYPQTLVRRLAPVSGSPRIRIRVRPRFDYGATAPSLTWGSHHIRYIGSNTTLRLTTNAPIDYVREETLFNLSRPYRPRSGR